MIKIKSLVFMLIVFVSSVAQADNQIFLMRHAEKALDQGKDPHLTLEGQRRALKIASLLKQSGIEIIYSTDYKRTQETVAPLAKALGLTIKIYDPRKLEEFSKHLKTLTGKIVVVGHSNTTPQLTSLLTETEVKPMTEQDYDDLYVVTNFNAKNNLLRLSTD